MKANSIVPGDENYNFQESGKFYNSDKETDNILGVGNQESSSHNKLLDDDLTNNNGDVIHVPRSLANETQDPDKMAGMSQSQNPPSLYESVTKFNSVIQEERAKSGIKQKMKDCKERIERSQQAQDEAKLTEDPRMQPTSHLSDYREVFSNSEFQFAPSSLNGRQIVTQLKEQYEIDHVKKFPFEKAQYHQCVPNPHNPDEFITVQIVKKQYRTISEDNPQFKQEEAHSYQEFYCLNKVGGGGSDKDDDFKSVRSLEDSDIEGAEHDLTSIEVERTYDIVRDKAFSSEEHKQIEMDEYAIIGFWRQNDEDQKDKTPRKGAREQLYECYHFFHIPNPVKRTIRNTQEGQMYEVIFPGEKEELFCFMQMKEDFQDYKEGIYYCQIDVESFTD